MAKNALVPPCPILLTRYVDVFGNRLGQHRMRRGFHFAWFRKTEARKNIEDDG